MEPRNICIQSGPSAVVKMHEGLSLSLAAPHLLCIIKISDSRVNHITCLCTNLLFHSLQVQLSYPVIEAVLEHTGSVLLLLELLLKEFHLKHSNNKKHTL